MSCDNFLLKKNHTIQLEMEPEPPWTEVDENMEAIGPNMYGEWTGIEFRRHKPRGKGNQGCPL